MAVGYRVIHDGLLLFCRDDIARIRYVVRTVDRYLDMAPMRKDVRGGPSPPAGGGAVWSTLNPSNAGFGTWPTGSADLELDPQLIWQSIGRVGDLEAFAHSIARYVGGSGARS